MNIATKVSLILATLGLSFVFLQAPAAIFAQAPAPPPADTSLFKESKEEACKGAQISGTATTDACTAPAQASFNKLLKTIINIFSIVIGIVAVIMVMVSGFRYITSGGDSNGVSAAKGTLLYAVVGLVIVAFAQLIVKFVLNKAAS